MAQKKENPEKVSAQNFLKEAIDNISHMSEHMSTKDLQNLQMILSAIYKADDYENEKYTGGTSNLLENLAKMVRLKSPSLKTPDEAVFLAENIKNTAIAALETYLTD